MIKIKLKSSSAVLLYITTLIRIGDCKGFALGTYLVFNVAAVLWQVHGVVPHIQTSFDGGGGLHLVDQGSPLCFLGPDRVRGLQSPEIFRVLSHIQGISSTNSSELYSSCVSLVIYNMNFTYTQWKLYMYNMQVRYTCRL